MTKNFQELSHDELLGVDGGFFNDFTNVFFGTVIVAKAPAAAAVGFIAGGPVGAVIAGASTVSAGAAMISNGTRG